MTKPGLPIQEFPQSVPNLTMAAQGLYELIKGRNLIVYPDANMRLAVSRAIAIETSRGWRIAKEKQAHKIDVIVALAQACHATVKAASVPEQTIPIIAPLFWSKSGAGATNRQAAPPIRPPKRLTFTTNYGAARARVFPDLKLLKGDQAT